MKKIKQVQGFTSIYIFALSLLAGFPIVGSNADLVTGVAGGGAASQNAVVQNSDENINEHRETSLSQVVSTAHLNAADQNSVDHSHDTQALVQPMVNTENVIDEAKRARDFEILIASQARVIADGSIESRLMEHRIYNNIPDISEHTRAKARSIMEEYLDRTASHEGRFWRDFRPEANIRKTCLQLLGVQDNADNLSSERYIKILRRNIHNCEVRQAKELLNLYTALRDKSSSEQQKAQNNIANIGQEIQREINKIGAFITQEGMEAEQEAINEQETIRIKLENAKARLRAQLREQVEIKRMAQKKQQKMAQEEQEARAL